MQTLHIRVPAKEAVAPSSAKLEQVVKLRNFQCFFYISKNMASCDMEFAVRWQTWIDLQSVFIGLQEHPTESSSALAGGAEVRHEGHTV